MIDRPYRNAGFLLAASVLLFLLALQFSDHPAFTAPLDATDKRGYTVSVRLNDAELARLDSQRDAVQMQRGEYLRAAALHRLPPTIPEVNREAWAALARTAANLNQIARHLNEGQRGDGERIGKALGLQLSAELANCLRLLVLVRGDLIGVKHDAEDVKDESEG